MRGDQGLYILANSDRRMIAGNLDTWPQISSISNAFVEFVPGLIDGLAHAEEADNAVTAFDRFLQALRRGGRLISLLSQNPDLVALVALVLGAAPRLGDMLETAQFAAVYNHAISGLMLGEVYGQVSGQRAKAVKQAIERAILFSRQLHHVRPKPAMAAELVGGRHVK